MWSDQASLSAVFLELYDKCKFTGEDTFLESEIFKFCDKLDNLSDQIDKLQLNKDDDSIASSLCQEWREKMVVKR